MPESPVFELRTYHAAPGKLAALDARFRDHTLKLFKKHGIEVVGFWHPVEQSEGDDQLVYIVRFPSRAAADERWNAFRSDPVWIETKAGTEVDGVLAPKIDSVFLEAADFSPLS